MICSVFSDDNGDYIMVFHNGDRASEFRYALFSGTEQQCIDWIKAKKKEKKK